MTAEELTTFDLPITINLKMGVTQNGETKIIEHTLNLLKVEVENRQNRASTDDIILTEKGQEIFKSFATSAKIDLLDRGIRTMLISSLFHDLYGEEWSEDFLEELKILYQFLDEVREEYGPPR